MPAHTGHAGRRTISSSATESTAFSADLQARRGLEQKVPTGWEIVPGSVRSDKPKSKGRNRMEVTVRAVIRPNRC
jgi:hypothetical protein